MTTEHENTIHPETWRFMRGAYRRFYGKHPEMTLNDWLRDMRIAREVLRGEDVRVDMILAESVAILEHTIVARGGQLPPELA